MAIAPYKEITARTLLTQIGMGQFNATQAIVWLFTQPATSDPKQPAVILIVSALQRQLNRMGAGLNETGYLDLPTASALTTIVGDRWETLTWADNIKAVISARDAGLTIAQPDLQPVGSDDHAAYQELGLFGLPDVPGGIVTYGVAAYLLYRYLKKRRN